MRQFLINSKLLEKREALKLYSSARSSKIAYVAPLAGNLGAQSTLFGDEPQGVLPVPIGPALFGALDR